MLRHDALISNSCDFSTYPAARKKGKSLLCKLDDYCVVDIETTGLSPEFDDIIEIAAVRVRNHEVVDTFSSLVHCDSKLPTFIVRLTGITDDMLCGAPDISETMRDFLSFVSNDTVVGHNVSFDVNFIYDACVNLDFPLFANNHLNTVRLSWRFYPELPNHKLATLIDHLSITCDRAHRALADALSTQQCYEIMCHFPFDFPSERRHGGKQLKASELSPADVSLFDEDCELYGKSCVFTGTLTRMTRREAMQKVIDVGGFCEDRVTQQTDFLVLGTQDYRIISPGNMSRKHKKAFDLMTAGYDIRIIPEGVFLDMLSEQNQNFIGQECD